jgi:hypothetical protein
LLCDAAVAVELPYRVLSAKAKDCDLCVAAVVIGDQADMPASPDFAGAHRIVTVRPIFALKGTLPSESVHIRYFGAEPVVNDQDKIVGWNEQHAHRLFQAGAMYFFFLNTLNGDWTFRDTPECCFLLDDPLREGREQIVDAFKKAELLLPDTWEEKTDSTADKFFHDFIPPFGTWTKNGTLIACIKIKTAKVVSSEGEVTRASIPKWLHGALIEDPDKQQASFIAQNLEAFRSQRTSWTREGLPLLAFLAKRDAKAYSVLEVGGALLSESIPLNDLAPENRDVVVRLAYALEAPALQALAAQMVEDAVVIVPVAGGKESAALYESCGRPVVRDPLGASKVLRRLRALAALRRQTDFLDSLIGAQTPPSKADMKVAGMLIGKVFSTENQGYEDLATFWWKLRPDFTSPLDEVNPATGTGVAATEGK